MSKKIRQEIHRIKKKLFYKKESIGRIEKLIKKSIDKSVQVNLWELSDYELEEEMRYRLISLNRDSNCLPKGRITSHREKIGWIIIFFKKVLRVITIPYSRLILSRQNRFNQDLVTFHMATFLKLLKIKDRIRKLETQAHELMESQQDLLEELRSTKSAGDNYK